MSVGSYCSSFERGTTLRSPRFFECLLQAFKPHPRRREQLVIVTKAETSKGWGSKLTIRDTGHDQALRDDLAEWVGRRWKSVIGAICIRSCRRHHGDGHPYRRNLDHQEGVVCPCDSERVSQKMTIMACPIRAARGSGVREAPRNVKGESSLRSRLLPSLFIFTLRL